MSDSPSVLRLPLKVTLSGESVSIRDAIGMSVCYIHFDDGCPIRRSVRQRLTKGAAIEVAKIVARALTDAAVRGSASEGDDDGRMARPTDTGEPSGP